MTGRQARTSHTSQPPGGDHAEPDTNQSGPSTPTAYRRLLAAHAKNWLTAVMAMTPVATAADCPLRRAGSRPASTSTDSRGSITRAGRMYRPCMPKPFWMNTAAASSS